MKNRRSQGIQAEQSRGGEKAGREKTKAQRQNKSKQTKQTQEKKRSKNTIYPSMVYVQLSTLHDSHRLICWKEGTQENSMDVKHPETGAVRVWVTAKTVHK